MKKTLLSEAVKRVVDLKTRALDVFLERYVEPLEDFGNPETLIGKPYSSWTPADLAALQQLYGTKEPNPLSNLIFRREYEKVKQLEAEEV